MGLMPTKTAMAFDLPVIYESIDAQNPKAARVCIQLLQEKDGDWVPTPLKVTKRESIRFFLRQSLDKSQFKRNAFDQNQIWLHDSTSMKLLDESTLKDYTIQMRNLKILRRNKYVADGHLVYPNWKTRTQKDGQCEHEFIIILKIADGCKYQEQNFEFFL